MSSLDDLLSGGGKSFKFENPGDTVTGVIVSVAVRQATEFGTGKPQHWDDGSPQEQIVVTITTDQRDPADPQDDGARSIYIKGWGAQLRAFKSACNTAGAKPKAGATFTATFTGYGPKSDRGGFPPKVFEYRLQPGIAGLNGLVGDTTATAAAAPVQQLAPSAPTAGPSAADKVKLLLQAGMAPEAIAQQLPEFTVEQVQAIKNTLQPA